MSTTPRGWPIGRARDDGHRTGLPRNAQRNRLPHARDAPPAHAALPARINGKAVAGSYI
jgi:hypothetical protein